MSKQPAVSHESKSELKPEPREPFQHEYETKSSAGTIALAAVRIGQHQVDVRRKIQLAAAKLAKAQHDHSLQYAVVAAAMAIASRHGLFAPTERRTEQGLVEHAGRR